METFQIIITAVVSLISGGLSGIIVYFVNIKSRKKSERANAESAEADAKAKEFANLKAEIEFNTKITQSYREELVAVRAELQQVKSENQRMALEIIQITRRYNGQQKVLEREIKKKKTAEKIICQKEQCKEREPVIGTFHTQTEGVIFLPDI